MPSGILDALISLSYMSVQFVARNLPANSTCALSGLEYNPDLGALPRTLFSKQAHYTGNWPFPLYDTTNSHADAGVR